MTALSLPVETFRDPLPRVVIDPCDADGDILDGRSLIMNADEVQMPPPGPVWTPGLFSRGNSRQCPIVRSGEAG
jgi:hypothetical protein